MDYTAQRDPGRTAFIEFAQLVPRPVRDDEISELRALWWCQAALGHRLPDERGVIVIEGGRITPDRGAQEIAQLYDLPPGPEAA